MASNDKKVVVNNGGIGLFGALFLIMFTLKITGLADISWLLVTAPLWGPTAFVFVAFLTAFSIFLVIKFFVFAWKSLVKMFKWFDLGLRKDNRPSLKLDKRKW